MDYGKFIPKTNNGYSITKTGIVYSHKNGKIKKKAINLNNDGYFRTSLYYDSKIRTVEIHKLMAIAYLNHVPCGMKIIVDHIDQNKQNNNLCNIRLVNNSENIRNTEKVDHIGVEKFFRNNKITYRARIWHDGKNHNIGTFDNLLDAKNAYNIEKSKYDFKNGIIKKGVIDDYYIQPILNDLKSKYIESINKQNMNDALEFKTMINYLSKHYL